MGFAIVFMLVPQCVGLMGMSCLQPSGQQHYDEDDDDQTGEGARAITPGPAMWPDWKKAGQYHNQNNEENGAHDVLHSRMMINRS